MNHDQARSAAIEPEEFFASPLHFPDCSAGSDESEICVCDAIERDMRDAFAAMTRENY